MAEQLIKKTEEGHSNVMPKSWIEAITDKSTGESLTHILQGFNMYFLSYTGNTEQTRCQVPKILRKKGLWVTYVKYDGNVYTEWYNSNDIDDKSWGNSSNWRIGNNELVGDLTISANGNWVINGNETEFKAIGEKGNTPLIRIADNKLQVSYDTGNTYHNVDDNPVYTQIRTYNNKLQISTDLGANWTDASDEIAAYFRFNSGQGNNVGSIQISRNNKDWNDLSGNFVNNLHISKYIGADETLPTSGIAEGTIYAKGPTYADSDTSHSNPIYRLWVYAYKGSTLAWQDNGEFTSISAGIAQELGDSENLVVSQRRVSQEIIQGGVYDVSSHNNSAVFESLQALLSSPSLSTFIPESVRHGGMSIKFIQGSEHSSDNKYVQYRLMANTFSTTVANWQGVDNEPTIGSNNLVKSGGVADSINKLKNAGYLYAGIATPTTNPGTPDGYVFYIANGKGTYTNFSGIDITEDEVVVLYYDTVWHKETTGIASNDKLTELERDIYGTITKSITLAPNVYYTINGIDYSEIGSSVKIKASCPVGKVVWVYTIINGTRTNVATLRDGNAKEITIVTGLTAIEVRSQEDTDFDAILEISKSTYILQEISQLVNSVDGIKSDIQGIDLRKYPFASDATFTQNGIVYDLNNYIKSIQLDNCKNNALYYVRIFYNSATYRMLVISEKDAQGNVSDIVTYKVSHTEKYIGAESIKFGNLTCYLIWGDFGYDNLRDTTAPLHRMVCKESSHPDSAIILPTNLYLATGVEFNAYSRMIISNVADNDIVDFSCGGSMRKHKRGFRYTATDTSPNINNENMKVRIAGNVEISKKFNIKPVRSTSGAGKTLNVLCLGSSTTDQGYYIEHTRDLFSSDAMNVNFLGTIQTKGSNPTNCEGRSGWRLRTFFSSDGTSDAKPQRSNPFFDNTKEEFSFDAFNFSMYMRNQGYSSCDVLIIAMASNDNVSTQQNEGYAKNYCDAIIASAKAYNPNIIIGIWLHNAGYYFYEGALNQIDLTLELNKKVISWYDNRETENIFVMPVNANVDPLYDYPCREDNVSLRNSNFKELTITDPVHVDKSTGAKKIGDICYSYLKYWGGIELD